jgi:GntR family transcriptional regulator, arabinose operon transcriptional repressor
MQSTMTKIEKVSGQLWQTVHELRKEGATFLPPETVLCEQYGVSRGTIQRAMNEFVQKGVLRRVAGKGTFICQERTPEADDFGGIPMIGLAYDAIELSEFRVMNIRALARAAHSKGLPTIVLPLAECMSLLKSWFPTQRGMAKLTGLISCNFPREMIEELKNSPAKIPYVALVNPEYEDIADYAVLRLDELTVLFEYLCKMGHRSFFFLEDAITASGITRINEAVDYMRDRGVEVLVSIREFLSDRMRATEEVDHIFEMPKDKRPSAIVCYDDRIASWVIRHLTLKSIKVPEDISVIGRGNHDISSSMMPAITSLCMSYDDLAEQAIELFLAQISGEHIEEPIRKVACRVISRETVADINVSAKMVS